MLKYEIWSCTKGSSIGSLGILENDLDRIIDKAKRIKRSKPDADISIYMFEEGFGSRRKIVWKNGNFVESVPHGKISGLALMIWNYMVSESRELKRVPTVNEISAHFSIIASRTKKSLAYLEGKGLIKITDLRRNHMPYSFQTQVQLNETSP